MSKHDESSQQQYRITVTNRTQSFQCAPDKTLLAGMELMGVKCIQVGCRGGGCGMCKIRVLRGDYESKRMSRLHVSKTEQEQGFTLSCRTFPLSDMVIESDHFDSPDFDSSNFDSANLDKSKQWLANKQGK